MIYLVQIGIIFLIVVLSGICGMLIGFAIELEQKEKDNKRKPEIMNPHMTIIDSASFAEPKDIDELFKSSKNLGDFINKIK